MMVQCLTRSRLPVPSRLSRWKYAMLKFVANQGSFYVCPCEGFFHCTGWLRQVHAVRGVMKP